ncbi:hypothetical protein F511_16474 [Dorcoceras hygrometricum]|uniref:Uncharacterized protein n=1 Tax=Dorcoceras hygrometricum TaxID=472368 RepID=A0A2Z7D473_9LAMI|nr:hypothetical protein F511_16474 [Dorcoceras hygrometricum]
MKPKKDDKKSYYKRRDWSIRKMFRKNNNDHKLLAAEESSSKWADTDSEESTSSNSSGESEQEKVHCLVADDSNRKLHEAQKPLDDKSGLGFSSKASSSGEKNTQLDLAYDKFKKMDFVKARVIHDTVGIRITPPGEAAEEQINMCRETINTMNNSKIYDIHRMFKTLPCWHLCLAPTGFVKKTALHAGLSIASPESSSTTIDLSSCVWVHNHCVWKSLRCVWVNEACDWILRLVINAKSICRIFSARAKRCRINLCKRHRFAIAISKYHLLVNSSLRLDLLLYDVASFLRLDVQATCWYLATAGLKPSADCDDVTDDVINAKPSADSSARRRFIFFTSLYLLIANC